MSTATIDEGLLARARAANQAVRRAESDRVQAVAALDAAGIAGAAGYRSTARLVEDLFHLDPAPAKRLVAQAGLLTKQTVFSGEVTAPVLPATADAFAAGDLGSEHVTVIARAMDAIGAAPDASPADVADAETLLAEQARTLPPAAVDKLARRVLAHLDPDGVAPLDPPEPDDELTLGRRRGALNLAALVHDDADQELIREVLDRLATPRRTRRPPHPRAAPRRSPRRTLRPRRRHATASPPPTVRTTTPTTQTPRTQTPRTQTPRTGTPRTQTPPPTAPRKPSTSGRRGRRGRR